LHGQPNEELFKVKFKTVFIFQILFISTAFISLSFGAIDIATAPYTAGTYTIQLDKGIEATREAAADISGLENNTVLSLRFKIVDPTQKQQLCGSAKKCRLHLRMRDYGTAASNKNAATFIHLFKRKITDVSQITIHCKVPVFSSTDSNEIRTLSFLFSDLPSESYCKLDFKTETEAR